MHDILLKVFAYGKKKDIKTMVSNKLLFFPHTYNTSPPLFPFKTYALIAPKKKSLDLLRFFNACE